ncbi:MAG: class I SAM-dependent methyltransferase [Pseudomonadota bacterium]
MGKDRSLAERLHKKRFRRNRGSVRLRSLMARTALSGRFREPKLKAQLKGGRYALLGRIPKHAVGVEVGVWKGKFSRHLVEQTAPRQLHLVDPWQVPDADSGKVVVPVSDDGRIAGVEGSTVSGQSDIDRVYEDVCERFGSLPNVTIHRMTSLQAAPLFADRSVDWVYIDGSHYTEDVLDDLRSWHPKLRPGGLLMGDDYYWRDPDRSYTVKRAVDAFIEQVRPVRWVVFRGQFLLEL